ncbi:MAG: hypothetical protein LBN41_09010 [Enterobacteriaceae bacterium]|jgi:hypothetical protein|nr:hypothetical protein [Enterobacteriaceae bacterium]
MTELTVTVCDQDGEITLRREDLLKYATNANVIAAALMIRISRYAFAKLSPQQPVMRRELYWQIGFPGPGILDCIEMLSHAVREGRCLQNPTLRNPKAPFSLGGQFIFEIGYRGKTLVVWPDKTVFDDEFRSQVAAWQEAEAGSEGRQAFLNYKADKVKQILSLSDGELLHSVWKEG